MIYNLELKKKIIQITCDILKKHFFYCDDSLCRFLNGFHDCFSEELAYFEDNADLDTLEELEFDPMARLHFTCYFTSCNLRHALINEMHFTNQELYAFESILPKYTGEMRRYENKSEHTRKND